MKRNLEVLSALVVIGSLFTIAKAQYPDDYPENTLLIEVTHPFTSLEMQNGIVVTEQEWFNQLSIEYQITVLEPVFKSSDPTFVGFFKIIYGSSSMVEDVVLAFSAVHDVIEATPDYFIHFASDFPNDTYYGQVLPPNVHSQATYFNLIDLRPAWDITTGKGNIVIGVVDHPISTSRLDMAGQLWQNPGEVCDQLDNDQNGYTDDVHGIQVSLGSIQACSFAGDFHGTFTASVACAQTNNGYLIAGVAGGGRFGEAGARVLITSASPTLTTASEIAEAIRYAWAEGADVINMSFQLQENVSAIQTAIQNGSSGRGGLGTVFVAAAGNIHQAGGWPQPGSSVYPANYTQVISVGSCGLDGYRYSSSMYGGDSPIFMAPGERVYGLLHNAENVDVASGTSEAAPHVSGVVALMLSVNPQLTRVQVRSLLYSTCTSVPGVGTGAGRINAHKAVKAAFPTSNQRPPGTLPQNLTLGSGYHIFKNASPNTDYFYVNGSLTLQSGSVLIVEQNAQLVVDAGETITLQNGSRVVLENGATVLANSGSQLVMQNTDVIFQGTGSSITTAGGTIVIPDAVTLNIDGGLLSSLSAASIQFGNSARLVIHDDATMHLTGATTLLFGSNSRVDVLGTVELADNLTINSGGQVVLKIGSNTHVSDNKKIIVQNGAALIKEPGSELVFGTDAKLQLNPIVNNAWNMTGIPVVVSDFQTPAVYPTATSPAWALTPSGYVATNPLTNNRGWWIKFGSSQIIQYEGDYIDYMEMVALNGWNIIGSISSPILSSTLRFYSNPPGILLPPYFSYNAGYDITDTLKPGGGYWVKTSDAGEIILDLHNQLGAGRGVPGIATQSDSQVTSLDMCDRFIITDAAGGLQKMYVRNGSLAGTTENIEMPPPPPDTLFDVRLSSGNFLQSVIPDSEGTTLSIALNQVVYPVELSWVIHPENGLVYSILPDSGNGFGRPSSHANISGSGSLAISNRGNGTVRFRVSSVSEPRPMVLPVQYSLDQNYPNPFNPMTTIAYAIPEDALVSLKVFDLLGREIAVLESTRKVAGSYAARFDAIALSSGIYIYRLQAGKYNMTRKMLLLK